MPVSQRRPNFAFIAIGLVNQVIGHSGFNWAVRAISPMILALLLLMEPILSAALDWIYFREEFGIETINGGALNFGGDLSRHARREQTRGNANRVNFVGGLS